MEELDLKELLEMFWHKKLQIILIVLIFVGIGVIYTMGFVHPVYSSSTTLVLAGSGNETSTNQVTGGSITTTDITINSKLVATYSELVTSKKVVRQVISNLNIDVNETELQNNISVSARKNTELIEITVTNANPNYAAQIANETAKVFTQEVGEIYNINNVHVVDEAEVATVPSNINHTKDIMIFTLIGLVIAVIYVLISNMLDTTLKSTEEIEKYIKLPILASIPVYGIDTQKHKTKGGRR